MVFLICAMMGSVGGVEAALVVDWDQMGECYLVERDHVYEIVEGRVGMGKDETLRVLQGVAGKV